MRLIDADALINEINNNRYPGAPYVDTGISIAIGKVCDAPTIEERKTGKWIKYEDRNCWHCSECGTDNYYAYAWDGDTGSYGFQDSFCPNCGADMRQSEGINV